MGFQLGRRRRTSASTAAARTLPISAMGNRGPSPPPPVDPLNAFSTLDAGDDPPPAGAGEVRSAAEAEAADGSGPEA